MSSNDQMTLTPSMSKRPTSRKHRVRTYSQTRLPSLLSKSNVFLSTSETTNFKRYHSQNNKDTIRSSTSNLQTRLPPLNSTVNENNLLKKQRADLQRRQIYALNHLMRELEQEKFREFCQLNGLGMENSVEIVSNDEQEDLHKQSTTLS